MTTIELIETINYNHGELKEYRNYYLLKYYYHSLHEAKKEYYDYKDTLELIQEDILKVIKAMNYLYRDLSYKNGKYHTLERFEDEVHN